MSGWFGRLIAAFAIYAFVRGIWYLLNSIGYHPEQWIAEVMSWTRTPGVLAGIAWSVSGLFALVGLIFWPRIEVAARSVIGTEERPSDLVPDWPIKELFLYLEPEIQGQRHMEYERLAKEVTDKLSTGQLKVWGRATSITGDHLPISRIDPDYWQRGELTGGFLVDDAPEDSMVHARPRITWGNARLSEYKDLRVNKAQAIKVIEKEKALDYHR